MPTPQKGNPSSNDSAIRRSRLSFVAIVIFCLLGALAGAVFQEPLALAAVVGVLLSWVVGIFIVAPRAARMAKLNILISLADPTEEDMMIIQAATTHILGNAARIAEDPEKRALFAPIWHALVEQINLEWDMQLKNLASQREKGVGQFAGGYPQISEEELDSWVQELKFNILGGIVDPALESFGFEGEKKSKARAVFFTKLLRMGSNGGQAPLQLPAGSPAHGVIDHRGR